MTPVDAQTTGGRITNAIDTALEPVKKAEREAWSRVPNYPIPSSNFDAAAIELKRTPMPAETESAVKSILDYADRVPKTTEGMQSIERTINDKMFSPNTDPNVKRVLGQLKQAIGDDFTAMGTAAEAGDVALHEGKVVYPSKIQAEIDALQKQAEAAGNQGASLPEQNKALFEYLAGKGELVMQNNGITPEQYAKTLQTRLDYLKGKGMGNDYVPPTGGANQQLISDLNTGIAKRKEMLANIQPAEDVATAYKTAKDVSKARFAQFGRGAVNEVMQAGNQASGQRLQDSAIARKFLQPENADGLITAIGKPQAAQAMQGHFADDLISKVQNPQTGELVPAKLAQWLKQNGPALDKYGIKGQFETVNAAHQALDAAKQAETAFNKTVAAKMLNADPQQAIAAAMGGAEGLSAKNTGAIMAKLMKQVEGNPQAVDGLKNGFKDFIINLVETTKKTISGDNSISPASIQKALAKYEPAMNVLYKDSPQQLKALKDIQKAVEIQGRSAASPVGGGSDTAENQAISKALGFIIDKVPGVNTTLKLAKLGLSAVKNMNAEEVNTLVAKALYDPELAKTLMMAAKGQAPKEVERRLTSYLSNYITAGAGAISGMGGQNATDQVTK